MGDVNSFHNNATMKCENLMKQGQSIRHALYKKSEIMKNEYRIWLNASVDSCRFLLRQRLPFRGHDETEESSNKGKFMELLRYTADQNEVVVDESADVSYKEHVAVVFRFVDKCGIVKERFINMIHVSETSSATLKSAIDFLFEKYGLSIKKVRGQGYDGASNMKGEFNGLKSLVLNQNASAHDVHCFAHQLQLLVVAVAKKNFDVGDLSDKISLLMNVVGGLMDNLYVALQKRDQEILTAISLVKSTRRQLQEFRDNGWDPLMIKVSSFCEKYDIENLDMEGEFASSKKPKKKSGVTNLHYYKVDRLNVVLDLELREFDDRFNEVNTELLICAASLYPFDSFSQLDHSKLMRVSKFYMDDFSYGDYISLEQHLDIYIDNVRRDERFSHLKNLGELARVLVEKQKHMSHTLVYRLLKLVSILSVATASVERCFSAMKIVKTDRHNRIGDQFLNDCLVCYIKKDVFENITNETVMKRFQSMKDRRTLL